MSARKPCSIVILVSGRGTNMQAVIDAVADGSLPVEIRAVISNRPGVAALQRATDAGLQCRVLDHTEYDNRMAFDRDLMTLIDSFQPDLVVLAGFMRILTENFVNHYLGRLINIHPALLPKYPGLNTHEQALAAGDARHGATVHFVTAEVDGGPCVLHADVPVLPEDTADSLAARVLEQEHTILPMVIKWYALEQLSYRDGKAYYGDQLIPSGGFNLAQITDN
jgi:phosphoribosylglycinamide formyltransferase-1